MFKKNMLKKIVCFSLLVLLLSLHVNGDLNIKAGTYYDDLKPTENVVLVEDFIVKDVIQDFNDTAGSHGWINGENVKSVKLVNSILSSPGSPYEGNGCMEVTPGNVKVYKWRTIYKDFDQPLNLSDSNFLVLAANSWGWQPEGFYIKIRLHSHDDIYEGISKITSNKWDVIALDISKWEGRDDIEKMEVSFVLNYDLEGLHEGDPGYEYWDGRFQIDYVATANTLNMGFEIDGNTEGFIVNNGDIKVENNNLIYNINTNSYLESPILNKDISKYNALFMNLNSYNVESMKIQWITSTEQNWDENKSMIFKLDDIKARDNFYKFVFVNSDHWKGNLLKFRIIPLSDSGKLEIDKISLRKEWFAEKNSPGKIDSCIINKEKNKIYVSGTVNKKVFSNNYGKRLALFELPTYEYDIEGYEPIDIKPVTPSFRFKVPLMLGENSNLYKKYVLAYMDKNKEYSIISNYMYITNAEILSERTYDFPQVEGIKGLQVGEQITDSEQIGIKHAGINVPYNMFLYKSNNHPENTIVYKFEGKTYYFKKNYVENLDELVTNLTNNGVIVTGILTNYWDMNEDTPNEHIMHPDAMNSGLSGGTGGVYAFNTKNEIGVNYFKAITYFIAERYTREDSKYGRIYNYVVGNEIGQNKAWYNMGPKLLDEYLVDYGRTLRLADTVIKSVYKNARTYISLDHHWNAGNSDDSLWTYDNKSIVDYLTKHIKQTGDFYWNIAFHPYPENLFDPLFWEDVTAIDNFNTPRITFKNLEILVDYISQNYYEYNGERRRIILSEQGFHSGNNSLQAQKIQAAAYAYAYYKIKFLEGIDSFILHRHIDHPAEAGLNLGLVKNYPGTINDLGEKKYIYDVFKYIDTNKSLEVTEFAKKIIGINKWSEVIPNFDSKVVEDRYVTEKGVFGNIIESKENDFIVSDFLNDLDGWKAAEHVKKIDINQEKLLTAEVNHTDPMEYHGVYKEFTTPIDLSTTPILKFDFQAEDDNNDFYEVRLRIYSDDKVIENSMSVKANELKKLAFDLSKWKYNDQITKIKIWVKPVEHKRWQGFFSVSNMKACSSLSIYNATVNTGDINLDNIEVGTEIKVNVKNTGNDVIENIMFIGLNGLKVDKEMVDINVLPGQEKEVSTIITDLNIDLMKKGQLLIKAANNEYIFDLTDVKLPQPPTYKNVLGSFEYNNDGWLGKDNIRSLDVKSYEQAEFLNPKLAPEGINILQVSMDVAPAAEYKIITKEFKNPIDLSEYSKLIYNINSWGSPAEFYKSKLILTGDNDEKFEKEYDIEANTWNEIVSDISACEFLNKVKSVSIGFKTVDWNELWAAKFFIDDVFAIKDEFVIGDFEGDTDGWKIGSNTTSVKSSEPGVGIGYPPTAISGDKILAVQCDGVLCTDYKTVIKDFSVPLEINYYDTLNFNLRCWGGVPNAEGYKVKIGLYNNDSLVLVKEYDIQSDGWKQLTLNLSEEKNIQQINRIEIGFASNGGDILWAPMFYLDNIVID